MSLNSLELTTHLPFAFFCSFLLLLLACDLDSFSTTRTTTRTNTRAMATTENVAIIYKTIIDNTIQGLMDLFDDEGVDRKILEDLKDVRL
jgi:hypothetical protein